MKVISNNENISFKEDISCEDPGNAQTYKDKCVSELKDDALLMPLVNVLCANNCLSDFMLLVKQIAARTLPVMNIAFFVMFGKSQMAEFDKYSWNEIPRHYQEILVCCIPFVKRKSNKIFLWIKELGTHH